MKVNIYIGYIDIEVIGELFMSVSKYSCAMVGCEEKADSGLFKIEEKSSYIIPLCDSCFRKLVVLRDSDNNKKILMIIDYDKLPTIEILDTVRGKSDR